ncbi:uncharacterized protein V6R79_018328, partial [Siganus canaliculatus]
VAVVEKPQRISGRRHRHRHERCVSSDTVQHKRDQTPQNYQRKFVCVSSFDNRSRETEGCFQTWLQEGGGDGELNLVMFTLRLGERDFENTEQRRVVVLFCARSSHSLWPQFFSSPPSGL